jgi:hypothetical protein
MGNIINSLLYLQWHSKIEMSAAVLGIVLFNI